MAEESNRPPYLLSGDEEKRVAGLLAQRSLPPVLEAAVGDYFTRKAGRDWHDPVILDRIRHAITAQKGDDWKPAGKRTLSYTRGYQVLGYLAYHFPVYYLQTRHILAMLARDGLLKPRMTILDAGTGPGVVPLAIAEFWSLLDNARADVYSIEGSEEHAEAFLALRDRCVPKGGTVSVKPPIRADLTEPPEGKLPPAIDLLVFSNVLNELFSGDTGRRADLVMQYAKRLVPDGTILIIEPAEEVTSTGLRILSLALRKRGLSIWYPCTFIRGDSCTPDRCWSFETAPSIRPTGIMEALAAGSPEPWRLVNTDIKYSSVVLRKDGRTRCRFRVPAGSRVLRLSQLGRHTGRRVNIIAAKMSGNLGDRKNLVYRLCDGSADRPVYAVVPSFHRAPGNEAICSAPYGTLLAFEGVLVRHNEKHDAFNVLVSRHTGITVAGEPAGKPGPEETACSQDAPFPGLSGYRGSPHSPPPSGNGKEVR